MWITSTDATATAPPATIAKSKAVRQEQTIDGNVIQAPQEGAGAVKTTRISTLFGISIHWPTVSMTNISAVRGE